MVSRNQTCLVDVSPNAPERARRARTMSPLNDSAVTRALPLPSVNSKRRGRPVDALSRLQGDWKLAVERTAERLDRELRTGRSPGSRGGCRPSASGTRSVRCCRRCRRTRPRRSPWSRTTLRDVTPSSDTSPLVVSARTSPVASRISTVPLTDSLRTSPVSCEACTSPDTDSTTMRSVASVTTTSPLVECASTARLRAFHGHVAGRAAREDANADRNPHLEASSRPMRPRTDSISSDRRDDDRLERMRPRSA